MKSVKEKWIFTAILAAIEIFLTAADLGFFAIGRIAFTILHIPVFIAVILVGLPQGFILAAIFGLSSMTSAYLHPSGLLDYLFRNPLISVLPRLMIPFAVWLVYKAVQFIADDNTLSADLICSGFAAMSGVVANAAFVVLSIAILSPETVGITNNLSASTVVITNIVAVNMLYEIVIAVAVTCLTVLIVRKRSSLTGSGRLEESTENGKEDAGETDMTGQGSRPIRKTFHKWLFLFMVMTFFFMLVFLYSLFTKQDRQHAQALLQGEANLITGRLEAYGTDAAGENLTFGLDGTVILAKDDMIIASGLRSLEVERLSDLCPGYDKIQKNTITDMVVNAVTGMGMIKEVNGITAVFFIPESEIYSGRDQTLAYLLFGLLVLFMMLFLIISATVQRNVVQRIQVVNRGLGQIRAGNLNEKVDVKGNTEFEELSLGINTTVDALKETMREIAEKNQGGVDLGGRRIIKNKTRLCGAGKHAGRQRCRR